MRFAFTPTGALFALMCLTYQVQASITWSKRDHGNVSSLTCTYHGKPCGSVRWTLKYNGTETELARGYPGNVSVTPGFTMTCSNGTGGFVSTLMVSTDRWGSYFCMYCAERQLITVPMSGVTLTGRKTSSGWVLNCTSAVRCVNFTVLIYNNSTYIGACNGSREFVGNNSVIRVWANGTGRVSLTRASGNITCIYSTCDTHGTASFALIEKTTALTAAEPATETVPSSNGKTLYTQTAWAPDGATLGDWILIACSTAYAGILVTVIVVYIYRECVWHTGTYRVIEERAASRY